MAMRATDLEMLADRLAAILAERFDDKWTTPDGWPGRADLCLLDSVFSTRARYEIVVRPLVERWRTATEAKATGALSDLFAVSHSDLVDIVHNKQKVPGRNPNRMLKVDAVLDVAKRLIDRGWNRPGEIVDAAGRFSKEFGDVFMATSGVGIAQCNYFLILLGVPGIKPDTLVTAWVERALGITGLSQKETAKVAHLAADRLRMSATVVDHTIWSEESKARAASRASRKHSN